MADQIVLNDIAINKLIQRMYGKVLSFVRSRVPSQEDAEDITQEVFMNIQKYKDNFDSEKSDPDTWVFVIAKRKLVDFYRARKVTASIDDMEYDVFQSDDDVERASEMNEMREQLRNGLEMLDERTRDVLILKFFKGLPSQEIGERLDISKSNVDVITHRGIKKLAEIIKK